MEGLPRHQCLIYNGSPAKMLPTLATHIKAKLAENFRCLYLNSPTMVAGIRSYLYAAGVDVEEAVASEKLVLSSEQHSLKDKKFDIDEMLASLEDMLNRALNDGYHGLFATGDMSWEMGLDRDLKSLLEYEWKLEKLFDKYPTLSGICQYHTGTLPSELVCHAVLVHPALFINHTLARLNPKYVSSEVPIEPVAQSKELGHIVKNLCFLQPENGGEL